MGGDNVIAFESAVRAVRGDLPLRVKESVLSRKDDYTTSPPVRYEYTRWRGRRQGTPTNPVYENDPDDWLWYDPKKATTLKSPVEVQDAPYTDYEKLLDVIKEEVEIGGIGWKRDMKRISTGRVEQVLPKSITKEITKVLTDKIADLRKRGHVDVSFREVVASQRGLKPPTPTFPKEENKQ